MMQYQAEEKTKVRRQRSEHAIGLAMQSRWEEAVQTNKEIIEMFPTDVDAYNRLGKALTEIGRYSEARGAYQMALDIDPNNAIAKKNLSRLVNLTEVQAPPIATHERVDPRLFIEEMGKTGLTNLITVAPKNILAKMSAGDSVFLKANGKSLMAENGRGEYLGMVEPKLALRLVNLMAGGNKYAAAITSLADNQVKIIIRETYQHPNQSGKVSFPTKGGDGFRPYIKESVIKYELEEDDEEAFEEEDETEYGGEWEEEPEHVNEESTYFEEPSDDQEEDTE